MAKSPDHQGLLKELADMLKSVFEHSPQAVYLYLDDMHKICNQKFAAMLGYGSVKQWMDNQYPLSDVSKKDQKKVVKAYMNASQKYTAATIQAMLTTKSGKEMKTEVTLVPLSYRGEVFVLHFISKK